ncbi:hypothetical protein LUZ63_007445 [Rhynchospora breviuscula]|uniref:Uncharacterized protein n=1 Tax=Rhynchospora breviuscula TaxID=2022672 RepID=A0A9Q0CRP6_9POAL|nr:hypothetical protein LUZ63_007445 [Rhynchospora breviuscula]
MDSLCRSSLHPNHLSCSLRLRPIPIPTPIPKPFFPKTLFSKPSPKPSSLSLRGAARISSPKPDPDGPNLFLSLLKPLSLTIATAAASVSILLSRFPSISPSLALASVSSPPAPASDTMFQPDSDEIASLRAETESKIEQGDFMGSIKTIDRLISLQPGNLDLSLLKAHLQSHTGDSNAAKRSFERLLEKDPYLVEAYHGLILTASNSDSEYTELRELMNRVEKTIELCKKEKDSKEKVRDFKLVLAQIKVVLGEYEESLKVYEEMEKEEPTDFRPYLCQGIVYTILEKKDEADKQFKKYKRLVPEGHPYEKYFDDMTGMKIFGEMREGKKIGSLKN